ncbi:restriction endonuclease subunit S, partial [Acinetobacter sp. TUM15103]
MATPKLRFKEFGGDWELDLLGNLVQIKSGYSPSKYELDKSGEMPFLKVEELNNCDKYQEYSRFYTERNSDAVPSKSVVFPKRGAAILNNKVRILRVDALLDSNLMALIPQHSLDAEYLYYLINKIELYKIADTSTIPQINNKHIEPYSIYLPSKEEQTKIASFLSNVDEKISQLTQKHELLSQYKQGMMQKLFSQQIRFKADDGSEFGEWEEKELYQIFQIKAGGDIDKDSVSEVKTSEFCYPIFANSDKNKGFYGWANKFKYTEAVTVTGRGNLGVAVARNKPFYPIVRLLVLLPLIKQNLKFFEEQINLLDIVSESTGVPQLTAPQLSKYKVYVPSFEEQTKIANFLSSIDQKIEVAAQQIE